ncbi:PH domain-containing protein [Patescibacteria group bacterium]|nr:PH domain-containing protein [Patescibacteria group bacterium]
MNNEGNLSGEFVINEEEKKANGPKPSKQINNPQEEEKKEEQPGTHLQNPEEVETKLTGLFTALSIYPKGIHFESEEENEKIIILMRSHFITNIPWILTVLILALLPLFFLPFLQIVFPFLDITPFTKILYTLFYYLVLLGFVLIKFSMWYFEVSLVTNQRIVDVDIEGILYRSVAKTKLDLVQDVSYTQVGSLRTIFNYGDVFIETAGELPNFHFKRVPEPNKIVDILIDLIGKK